MEVERWRLSSYVRMKEGSFGKKLRLLVAGECSDGSVAYCSWYCIM
jgi:hypothetical protein